MLRAVFLQKAVLQTSGGNYSSLFWPLVYRLEHQSSSWYTLNHRYLLVVQHRKSLNNINYASHMNDMTKKRWPIKSIYLYWFTSLHKRASCLWLNWEKNQKIYNTIQSAFSKRLNSRKKKTLHKLKFWLVHLFTFVPLNTQFYSQIFNLCLL